MDCWEVAPICPRVSCLTLWMPAHDRKEFRHLGAGNTRITGPPRLFLGISPATSNQHQHPASGCITSFRHRIDNAPLLSFLPPTRFPSSLYVSHDQSHPAPYRLEYTNVLIRSQRYVIARSTRSSSPQLDLWPCHSHVGAGLGTWSFVNNRRLHHLITSTLFYHDRAIITLSHSR